MKNAIVPAIIIICIVLMYQYPHLMLNPGDLTEAHQKINNKCLACHDPFSGISNAKCITCHKLTDIGKNNLMLNSEAMAKEKILFHQNLTDQKCPSCHTDHKGAKPGIKISNFSHSVLTVAQANNCNGCHVQPADNLHKLLSKDCNSCHNTKGWKSAVSFNHDMIQGIGKNNCASCHQKPNDSFHQQVKDNCDKCHITAKWIPSTFDHSAYFQLDEKHNAQCITCHTNNNFSAYTCYGCHEHSESKIARKHMEHGISNFAKCASCHKSGNEHDIRMNGNSRGELNQKEIDSVKNYLHSKQKESGNENNGEEEDDD